MRALQPTDYLTGIHAIDFDQLRASGIDTLLFDLDNTLLPRNAGEVPDSLRAWATEVKSQGFKVCIVSNNWHDRVVGVAADIGFDLVAKAIKPMPFAFKKALAKMGSTPDQAAIIGDQIFTDVLGGKLLGIRTVLVVPMTSSDLPHTLLLRKIERVVLAGREPVA